jgi:hypothetical protein
LSTSDEFLDSTGPYLQKQKYDITDKQLGNRSLIGDKLSIVVQPTNMDSKLSLVLKLQNIAKLPYGLKWLKVKLNPELESYVEHIFVDGFEGYYSENRETLRNEDPKLFTFFEKLDTQLRASQKPISRKY